jgi:hypothetical protein
VALGHSDTGLRELEPVRRRGSRTRKWPRSARARGRRRAGRRAPRDTAFPAELARARRVRRRRRWDGASTPRALCGGPPGRIRPRGRRARRGALLERALGPGEVRLEVPAPLVR